MRISSRIALGIMLLAKLSTLACTSAVNAQTHSENQPHNSPSISLRAAQDDHWQLLYRFQEPIKGLRFADPAGFMREQSWVIETPGYYFGRDGDYQVVVASVNAPPSHELCITVPIDTRAGLWSNELFNIFTDASVALFTRHFYVTLFDPDKGDHERETLIANLEIIPKVNQHVIIRGDKSYGPMSWRDPSTEGTYAYTGTLDVEQMHNVAMIMDPGLPAWVTGIARLSIPALIDIYTERMGRPLDSTPLVLFSYEPGNALGYQYNGMVLGDLLQLRVQGAAWEQESMEMRQQLTQFIADEVIKLWSGQITAWAPGVPEVPGRAPVVADSLPGAHFQPIFSSSP